MTKHELKVFTVISESEPEPIEIFKKWETGRHTKMLVVHAVGRKFHLNYITYIRKKISKEQRLAGVKQERKKTLDYGFFIENISDIDIVKVPHKELTLDFINSEVLNKKEC